MGYELHTTNLNLNFQYAIHNHMNVLCKRASNPKTTNKNAANTSAIRFIVWNYTTNRKLSDAVQDRNDQNTPYNHCG
jgi:hypothetical protein